MQGSLYVGILEPTTASQESEQRARASLCQFSIGLSKDWREKRVRYTQIAWAHATIIPCPYKVVLGWTGVEGRFGFKDAERAKPWHRASVQPPLVLAWAHGINFLSNGCVHGGVGECQLLPMVFNFFSGAEQGKHIWDEAAESRKDQVPCLLPGPCAVVGWIKIPNWWETTALLFYTPGGHIVLSISSKASGNNWRSSQTHLSAILRHLAFWPVGMLLFLQYKKTNTWGYIWKKQVTHKWQ